jgi:hypothetical protein
MGSCASLCYIVSLAKATRNVPELLPEPDHGVVVGDVQQGSSWDILQTGKQTPSMDNGYSSQSKMSIKKKSKLVGFLTDGISDPDPHRFAINLPSVSGW